MKTKAKKETYMVGRVIRVLFLLSALIGSIVLIASAREVFGQEAPVVQESVPQVEKLTELEQAKIQAKMEKQKALLAEYDKQLAYVTAQFRESPEIRTLLAQIETVTKEANALVEKAFEEHKADKAKFRVNVDTGDFVPAAGPAVSK